MAYQDMYSRERPEHIPKHIWEKAWEMAEDWNNTEYPTTRQTPTEVAEAMLWAISENSREAAKNPNPKESKNG